MATTVPRATQGREPGYGHNGVVAPNDLVKVREALGRLRAVLDVHEIAERCVRELCETLGFDRAVLFNVKDGGLVADAAYVAGDSDGAAELLDAARGTSPRPNGELLRPDVIAAPVMAGETVIATLHVDCSTSGRSLTEQDLELLWTFAEGFGYAYDRTRLLARLRGAAA